MKIVLLQTGKTTDNNVSELASLYSKRISKYCAFETVTLQDIRNTKNMPVDEQKRREGEKIVQFFNSDDLIVLLDEQGKEYRTIELAVWMDKQLMMAKKRIVFVIGGPWGFSDDVYMRANQKLSLSRMTFPHQLVRLLFLEQLYRAFTIIRGEPYHHE